MQQQRPNAARKKGEKKSSVLVWVIKEANSKIGWDVQEIYGRKCLWGTSERGLEKVGSAFCLYCSSVLYWVLWRGEERKEGLTLQLEEFQLSQWEVVSLQRSPFCVHSLAVSSMWEAEKAMALHSGVLAWRIRGTGEPGELPPMGSHRVRHNWSNLAAAAACRKSGLSTVMLVDPKFKSFGHQSITLSSAKDLSGWFSLLLQSTTCSTQIYFSTLTWGGAPQWFPWICLHEEKLWRAIYRMNYSCLSHYGWSHWYPSFSIYKILSKVSLLSAIKSAYLGYLHGGVTQIFISENLDLMSVPLTGLSCCMYLFSGAREYQEVPKWITRVFHVFFVAPIV